MTAEKLCQHCGKPLHYTNLFAESLVNALVKARGEYVNVVSLKTNKTYKVQRHSIALHELKAEELDAIGFDEIK